MNSDCSQPITLFHTSPHLSMPSLCPRSFLWLPCSSFLVGLVRLSCILMGRRSYTASPPALTMSGKDRAHALPICDTVLMAPACSGHVWQPQGHWFYSDNSQFMSRCPLVACCHTSQLIHCFWPLFHDVFWTLEEVILMSCLGPGSNITYFFFFWEDGRFVTVQTW